MPKKRSPIISEDFTGRIIAFIAVVLIVVIAVAVLMMFFLDTATNKYYTANPVDEWKEGWEVSYRGETGIFDFPYEAKLEPGEELVISKKLPDDIPDYAAAVGRNYHMKVAVSVDGEEIYRYPDTEEGFLSTVLVDDWNVASLTEDMAGKEFQVKFTAYTDGFSGMIRPVYYGPVDAVMRFIKEKYTLFFVTGLSILASGIAILFFGLIYLKYDKKRTTPLVGIMLLITGIWLTNRSKMPVLGMGSSSTFLMCFLALALVPAAIAIYSYERFGGEHRLTNRLLMAFDILYIIDIIGALILGYTIMQLVLSIYLMMAVNMLYVLYLLWGTAFGKESHEVSDRERLRDRIEFIASALMLIGFVIETVAYTDELMTEVNMINRVAFNIFAAGHIINILIDNYNNAKDREEAKTKLHESQVELMMGQIQPHFMFNTLSSIRTLIKVEPETAYDMIYDFSNYLRANVDNMGKTEGISFEAEVEHIKTYVNIEKVRFGDRVNMEYDIQATNFLVPPLSIQPMVENAIKHGICKKTEGGTVQLKSYEDENNYVVEVNDDGVGFSPDRLQMVLGLGNYKDKEEDEHITETLHSIAATSTLRDARGNIVEVDQTFLENPGDLTGNGGDIHKSTGMKNIILRLKEMTNADIEIESREGEGTNIKVLFPKTSKRPGRRAG